MYIYVYIYVYCIQPHPHTQYSHDVIFVHICSHAHADMHTIFHMRVYIYTHLCYMYMQTHIISPVVPQKTTRNHSLNHWKLGPWRCMASCFFLLRQFEDVLVYLKSIKCLGRSQGWSLLDDGETWPICSLNGGL